MIKKTKKINIIQERKESLISGSSWSAYPAQKQEFKSN